MHWFIWILLSLHALLILGNLYDIQRGEYQRVRKPIHAGIAMILNGLIIVGILYYLGG